jgi:hypothetical protein
MVWDIATAKDVCWIGMSRWLLEYRGDKLVAHELPSSGAREAAVRQGVGRDGLHLSYQR